MGKKHQRTNVDRVLEHGSSGTICDSRPVIAEIVRDACPRAVVDTGKLTALVTGPHVAKLEHCLAETTGFLTKGLQPDARARAYAADNKAAEALGSTISGDGHTVFVPFDGSGWDGSFKEALLKCTELAFLARFGIKLHCFLRALQSGV